MKRRKMVVAAALCAAVAMSGMLASCDMGGNDYTAEEEAAYRAACDKLEEGRNPGCIKVTMAAAGDAVLQFDGPSKEVSTFSFDVYTEDASLGASGGSSTENVYCFAKDKDWAWHAHAGTQLAARAWVHVEVEAGDVVKDNTDSTGMAGVGTRQCGVKADAKGACVFYVDNFAMDGEVYHFRSASEMGNFAVGWGDAKIEYDTSMNGYDESTGFPQ